jgi:hypothetical protein
VAAQREAHARHLNSTAKVQQIANVEQQTQAELAQLKAATLEQYPDVVTTDDLERLRVTDPPRFQRLMQYDAAARQR